MYQPADTNQTEPELDDDDSTYLWMIENGYTEEEACRVLHNLHFYGSIHSPDDAQHDRSQNHDHYVYSDEFQRFLQGLDEMMAKNSGDSSSI